MFISHYILHIKEILPVNRNYKGNQLWIKNKEMLVSDTDIEKTLSTIFNFSQFQEHCQKQSYSDILQNRCSKKFRNILN